MNAKKKLFKPKIVIFSEAQKFIDPKKIQKALNDKIKRYVIL